MAPSSDVDDFDAELDAMGYESAAENDNSHHSSSPASVKQSIENHPDQQTNGASSNGMATMDDPSKSRHSNHAAPTRQSSHDSLGSGAMSESESEASPSRPPSPALGSTYPLEGKFVDARDRAEIMSLPEARREEILAERTEQMERESFARQLRQRYEAQQKETGKSSQKKRKVDDSDLEAPSRKLGQKKAKASENLEAYKKRREQHLGQRRGDQRQKGRRSPGAKYPSAGSGSSREGSSAHVEDGARAALAPSLNVEVDWNELSKYLLYTRNLFSETCLTPGFEDAARGMFVRVCVGPNRYRLGQIKDFKKSKNYDLELRNGMVFSCDQYIIVKQGKHESSYPFKDCSNSRPTETEYTEWRNSHVEANQPPPNRALAESKMHAIHALRNHSWTEQELTEKQRRMGILDIQNAEIKRNNLLARRGQAVQSGDEDEVARLDAELDRLANARMRWAPNRGYAIVRGERIQITQEQADEAAQKAKAQAQRIANINEKHRRKNAEDSRRIAAMEMQRRRDNDLNDPLVRKKARIQYHFDVDENGNLNLGARKDDPRDRSRTGTPRPAEKPDEKKKRAGTSMRGLQKGGEEEAIRQMDLDIDIEI